MEAYFTCAILIMIVFLRKTFATSIFNPTTILCGTWIALLTIMPIMAPEYYFTFKTSFFIILFCFFFFVGEFFIYLLSNRTKPSNVTYAENYKGNLTWFCWILSIISFLGSILYLRSFISYFGSFGEFLVAGALVRESLFEGDIQIPRLFVYLGLLGYSSVILSLTYYVKYGFRWFQVLAMMSVVLFSISQAGRAGIVIALLQVFAARIFRSILLQKKNQILNFIKPIGIILIVTVGLFMLIESFRSQNFEFSSENRANQFTSLNVYIFGGTGGFTTYLNELYPQSWTLTYGKYSFSALFQLLGIAKQETGVYDQYLHVSDHDTGNVYSVLRPLLDDFGAYGLVIWSFLIGAFSNFCFERAVSGRLAFVALSISFYSYLFFSPIAPLTQFNSFVFSLILCPIILEVAKIKFNLFK